MQRTQFCDSPFWSSSSLNISFLVGSSSHHSIKIFLVSVYLISVNPSINISAFCTPVSMHLTCIYPILLFSFNQWYFTAIGFVLGIRVPHSLMLRNLSAQVSVPGKHQDGISPTNQKNSILY